MTMPYYDHFIKHGIKRKVGDTTFHEVKWFSTKRAAQNEAENARDQNYRARVINKDNGWIAVVARK